MSDAHIMEIRLDNKEFEELSNKLYENCTEYCKIYEPYSLMCALSHTIVTMFIHNHLTKTQCMNFIGNWYNVAEKDFSSLEKSDE